MGRDLNFILNCMRGYEKVLRKGVIWLGLLLISLVCCLVGNGWWWNRRFVGVYGGVMVVWFG